MKILCDVCDMDEASLFCVADEAALCAACDHRVHHANKLAGKHQRFSLHHPKNCPLCDICQERRAFLFCRQDRAILCRDCDLSIHKANQHTQKHTRFLLTGLKLSATSALYSDNASEVVLNKPVAINKPSAESIPDQSNCDKGNGLVNGSGAAASSISEYLIEMLPGWHVEELLDSSFPYNNNGFCKSGGEAEVQQLWDGGERNGVWVPQFQTQNQVTEMGFGAPNLDNKEFAIDENMKSGRNWFEDTSFVVPQISQSFIANKRLKTFW